MEDRKVYIDKLANQLKEWDNEIEKLELQLRSVNEESKANLRKEIDQLQRQQDDLKVKMTKLKEAGDNAWQELRSGVERSWNDMKDAMQKAINQFQ